MKQILRLASIGDGTDRPRPIHYVGLPPSVEGGGDREVMPAAEYVAIEEHSGSGIFLVRYLEDGTEVGDTWHQSLDDAEAQAVYEFGDRLQGWRELPMGTTSLRAALDAGAES